MFHFLNEQVASELNAAMLQMENNECRSPKLTTMLKQILWAQEELDKKNIKYPKMVNIARGTIEEPK